MKSSYELAMERLNKSSPSPKLSEKARAEIAEVSSLYAAKIAEREIFLKGEIGKAMEKGDFAEVAQLEEQLVQHRKAMQAELEEKKEKIRNR